MSIYKHYIELKPIDTKIQARLSKQPLRVDAVFRRLISVAINKLHQIAKKKSIGGYATAIIESDLQYESSDLVRVQEKIRIFTKRKTSLEHLKSVLISERFFKDFYVISELFEVPEETNNYCLYLRIRLPTIKKHSSYALLKQQQLDNSIDCNFIYLMPSSSKLGNKKLIRYYYKVIPTDRIKPAQFSKPDSYGFSRTNRICAVAVF